MFVFRTNLAQLRQSLQNSSIPVKHSENTITNFTMPTSLNNESVFYIDAFEAQRRWWWAIFTSEYTTIYYSILFVLIISVAATRSVCFFRWCITASTNMHHSMFNNIVNSPMRFFNTNPSGRILNRFSKDIGTVDEVLPGTIVDTVTVSIHDNHKFVTLSKFVGMVDRYGSFGT